MNDDLWADIIADKNKVDDDDPKPRPEKSTILFELIMDGDEPMIEEIQYEGGSAELENEAGMLRDNVIGLLGDEHLKDGWYIMKGFYGWFSTDYWGEVDCDFSCDKIRPAEQADYEKFGIGP